MLFGKQFCSLSAAREPEAVLLGPGVRCWERDQLRSREDRETVPVQTQQQAQRVSNIRGQEGRGGFGSINLLSETEGDCPSGSRGRNAGRVWGVSL